MSLMAIIKFGYALVVVTLLLMIWASLSRALELHVDTGHPPCLFQALCTCSKPAGDLGIVTCSYVPILRVPAAINNSKVFSLELTGNKIMDLEPQFFQATGLYRLAINQNPLEGIHEEAFYGLDNTLWELELRQDRLTKVPSRSLRYLQKLRLLDLTGNEITDISGDNWRGLENTLLTLILADNSIASLPLDAFTGLPVLETLDLHGNHLSVIDSGVFRDGMNRLNRLLLGDNQLAYIPYEELSPLRQLRFLDLSNNLIKQVPPLHDLNGVRLSLDSLKLDNNIIRVLDPGSFKYFNVLNTTSLDGNPIWSLREDAFRNAKIKTLSLRDCGITDLSPASFAGLENSLQSLDLSENNLTMISKFMLNKLDSLRFLNLRENKVDINLLATNIPSDYQMTSFNNFQYKLFYLDVSGANSIEMSLQDVRRMRSLRYLSISKLIRQSIRAEDFLEFGVELEDLKIYGSTITRIESSAFQHVRTIKTLDLSENNIEFIDPFAFAELHSLTTLKMINGLADTVMILPFEPLKALIELQYLDLSNNRLKNVPDTSFHFLYKLKQLNLQDNFIDHFSKGTLQGDIHGQLESICLSLNQMRQIVQHTFVDLKELQEVLIEDNLIEVIQRRAFTSLDNLKVIKLRGNRINEITEEAFQNIPALKELDISFNQLDTFKFSIFDQVGSATALKVNASYNRIVSLTDSNAPSVTFFTSNFYPPPKAQRYNEDENENRPIGRSQAQGLGTVSVNIRVLDFSHNNITYIAPYYFRHADLTLSELHLSHNRIRNITREVFGSMNMLQYLDLSHNHIFDMEYDCFKKVKNLQIINLSHNHLIEMPVQLFHEMQSLTSVDLSDNRIRNLADNFLPSPSLERLDLSDNALSRVPTNCLSPAAAANLVELDLSGNTIPAISISDLVQRYRHEQGEFWPEEPDYSDEYMYHTARRDHTRVFSQKKQYPQNILYKSLAWLDLSGNHLVRVEGGSFSALPKLRWLDLSNNLPFNSGERSGNVFKGLERRLSHLGLKNVSLMSVPSMQLSKLKSLDLSYNNLPSIPPDTTANLTRLRALDLSYNDLTTIPVATHSLSELRWLSLSGNPITALMNTSLYGVSPRLEYLDVTRLRLRIMEYGVFSKMYALRTLKITAYSNIREINVPRMLTYNAALENLYIEVDENGVEFGKEMYGQLPCKLNNITITGRSLRYLTQYLLSSVQSKVLRLTVFNTSIEEIAPEVFWRPGRLKNLTLDVRGNYIQRVPNPSTKPWPGVPSNVFLQDILVAGNPLYCDCGIGWIEAWDRKRRQYLCTSPSKCVATREDARFATCPAYDNRTLTDLLLGDNQLAYIPYEELSPLRQLRFLDLSNNLIKQVPPLHDLNGVRLSLDSLKLDNNIIRVLDPGSFKYFNVLNTTSLDSNPIWSLREDAFRNAKIKTLSLRDCGITDLSPASFAGLENSLQSLDLSENNLTMISKFMLNKLDSLRFLNLRENKVDINLLATNIPSDYQMTSFNNFQYKLFYLDVSGANSIEMSLQDVRRMRSLRYLSISKLIRQSIRAEDFLEFGVDLEDLKIFGSTITRIESSAFQHVRTIKTLDLSENNIEFIDPFAFAELHSLTTLKMINGLADTVMILPFEPLKALIELQYLDLSNNRLKNVPDTSFHFLYKLKQLNLQDNFIDHFSKGTLQGDIHGQLESICLSLNQMRQIVQHTFVDLKELQEVLIEDNLIEVIQRRAFTSLDNLKVIKLRGNRINEITEEAFQNIPALKELDISFNQLDTFKFSIFDQVGSATALKVNASYNRIVSLTDSNAPSVTFFTSNFYPPPKAQRYNEDENENRPIGRSQAQGLGTVSVNIRVLDFSHNNITYIAPYYFRHADLTLSELHLSHNRIRNITREVFGSMNMLQYLDLSHNHIFDMEYDCFKKVKNLQIINLSHNHLIEMPVQLFHEMQSLTTVDLSDNRIRNLADNFLPSPSLERLDLSDNALSRVPTNCLSPAAAANLVELDLSGNTIPAISISDLVQRYRHEQGEFWPEEPDYSDEYMYHTARRDHTRVFSQKKQYPQNILYKSLAWLDLSGNHLVRVEGGSFSALPKLRWLDLSNNLPFNSGERSGNVFKGLERRLSHLGLKNVSLMSVPSMQLSKLKSLDLSYNNLPSIPPDTTANLTRLRALDLSYNDLTTIPVATHSLSELRWLSLSGNPITALMNTSLYGVSPRLEYLDVTRLRLRIMEYGVFSKMYALRTLKITAYSNIREINVPRMLTYNAALENLYIEVDENGVEFGKEMYGQLPCKLNNITITGRSLRYLTQYLLSSVQSKVLRLTVFNTSIEEIAPEVFWRPGRLKNLTLDVRGNYIQRVPNPSTKPWPGVPSNVFLQDILVAGNPLYCDCGIGWIEAWDRKRRQYLCTSPSKCVATREDARFATCPAYDNRTLTDVITRDLDCGWSRAFLESPKPYIIMAMTIITMLYI